jgi:hypothetical protein
MKQLPQEEDVKVVGVESGNKSEGLNYFATLLHEKALQDPNYSVRTVDIYSEYLPKHRTEVDVRRKSLGPLNVITILSFVLTIALLLFAISLGDGPGFIGVFVMSLTSTLLCAASHWKPTLPTRKASRRATWSSARARALSSLCTAMRLSLESCTLLQKSVIIACLLQQAGQQADSPAASS